MRCRIYLGEPTPLTEDGLLITNDLAELRPKAAAPESARLRILGRADEVIVSGGENVSPQSVETALCSLPEVELAFVCGVPDPTWGQMIVALWVPHAPAAPGVNLRERLRSEATLAVHAIPKVFLESSELPTLPSGKIDRRRAQTETLRRLGKVRQEG
jgi:O-succinylbenzoic acid--CoA ligase